MKIVFSILSHRMPDHLFEKLLSRLNEFPNATIAVHHDYNKCDFPEGLISKYNLNMVHPYYNTKWGHISKLPAILQTFKNLITITPDFDWLISVSPNCYPIKSTHEILEFLRQTDFDYFMESNPLGLNKESIYRWHYKALFTKRVGQIPWITRKGKFKWRHLRIPISRNSTPFNDTMYPHAGSDWYIFNRKTVGKILDADMMNHPIVHYITKSNEAPDMNSSPDEIVFQTFVKNQKDLNGSGNYYRFIDWKEAKDWHPNTLTIKHWEAIKQSDALFARKFDWNESKDVINLIDREILDNKRK